MSHQRLSEFVEETNGTRIGERATALQSGVKDRGNRQRLRAVEPPALICQASGHGQTEAPTHFRIDRIRRRFEPVEAVSTARMFLGCQVSPGIWRQAEIVCIQIIPYPQAPNQV